MISVVSKSDFFQEFNTMHPKQFSYEGLEILFNFFKELDPNMELDVIAICCEWTELSVDDILDSYNDIAGTSKEDVVQYLEERTTVLGETTSGSIMFEQF